jgi:hypothetical protein
MGLHDQDSGKPASEKDDKGFSPEGMGVAPDQGRLFEDDNITVKVDSEGEERSRKRVLVDRVMFCYNAGQTRRWHTRDHVIRTETIAAHSWNTTMWILLLHPSPSKNLIFASMVHDVPEHLTGDLPRWAKEESPTLANLLNVIEDEILEQQGLQCDLEPDDAKWLKAVDLFDAWLFIRQNILAGNRLMMDGWQRSTKALNEMALPPELAEVYDAIKWGDKV